MSFSVEVKEDILKFNSDATSRTVELEAMLRLSGEVVLGKTLKLCFLSSNISVIRHFITILKENFKDASFEIISKTMQKLNHITIYSCEIENEAREIVTSLALLEPSTKRKEEILSESQLISAYLRGAFLAKGTVNHPNTSNYHLEIVTDRELETLFIQRCMNFYSLNARISKRRSNLIVYIKEREAIVDFLRIIGANVSMNEFENVIIKRNIAANINRLMNIDVANQQKTNRSAKEQIKYIKYLEYHYPLDKLDPKILMVMKVRKENPEASLTEMLEIINKSYDDMITKSGLNHRLRKIKEIALDFETKRKES